MNRLCFLNAVEAINELKNGRATAVELARSCIDRIKLIDSQIKAWAYFNEEKIISQAKAIDEKISRNESTGPLCGVPVGIKDIFNTVDMPTCMGSPIWDGFTPGNDARVVTYIRWADGIIAGKTVTAEFAVHYPGPTVNPCNYNYSPGTSSSGSAAAVASYMVPLALGTQTAGSTIRPASYCGIYGFKPSFGLIPRTGILKTLDTLDHVSFFSRSVDDLYLIFDVLRVRGENYPFVHKFLDNPSLKYYNNNYHWKVAFMRTYTWGYAEKYAQDSILNYVSRLSNQKQIILEEVDLPEDFNMTHDLHDLIYSKALSYYFQEEYNNSKDKISRLFCEIVERGRKISIEEYLTSLEKQNELVHQLDDFLNKYDIIITLSTAGEAPYGLYAPDKKDSCLIWTLCHVPVINLPLFKSPNNLPFGAQIVSKRYRDCDLINFAKFLLQGGLINDWKKYEERSNL